jgi:hypothetical protein
LGYVISINWPEFLIFLMPPKKQFGSKRKKVSKQDEDEYTDETHDNATRAPKLTGQELTAVKQLRAQLAAAQVENKKLQAEIARGQRAHAKLLQAENSNRPQRRSTRSAEEIEREAQVNLVLRFQEQLSFRTMRRVRQASAVARQRTHSTGAGLSTEEDVASAQYAACEEVWRRGVRPITELTGVATDEGYYQDPVTVIQQYVQLHIELHQEDLIDLPEGILDEKVCTCVLCAFTEVWFFTSRRCIPRENM